MTGRSAPGRHLSEEGLRESQERFHQIAEHIREVIWMTTADLSAVLYVSRGYETVWGRAATACGRRRGRGSTRFILTAAILPARPLEGSASGDSRSGTESAGRTH